MNTPEHETFSSAAAPAPGIDSTSTASSDHPGNGLDSSSPSTVAASSAALLTPEQLALRLNVSRRCQGNWTRDRIIPMVKIGRVCRFDLSQVLAALKQHEQGVAKR